jgi:hypothetical protein
MLNKKDLKKIKDKFKEVKSSKDFVRDRAMISTKNEEETSKNKAFQERSAIARQDMAEGNGEATDFSTVGLTDEGLLKREIGLSIRSYKLDRGISDAELAKIIGGTVSQVRKIMHLTVQAIKIDTLVYFLDAAVKDASS